MAGKREGGVAHSILGLFEVGVFSTRSVGNKKKVSVTNVRVAKVRVRCVSAVVGLAVLAGERSY